MHLGVQWLGQTFTKIVHLATSRWHLWQPMLFPGICYQWSLLVTMCGHTWLCMRVIKLYRDARCSCFLDVPHLDGALHFMVYLYIIHEYGLYFPIAALWFWPPNSCFQLQSVDLIMSVSSGTSQITWCIVATSYGSLPPKLENKQLSFHTAVARVSIQQTLRVLFF